MADKCYAPIFKGSNFFACVILTIIYSLAIVAILIATLFLCVLFPSCRCVLRQYAYRIKKCIAGNSQANVEI